MPRRGTIRLRHSRSRRRTRVPIFLCRHRARSDVQDNSKSNRGFGEHVVSPVSNAHLCGICLVRWHIACQMPDFSDAVFPTANATTYAAWRFRTCSFGDKGEIDGSRGPSQEIIFMTLADRTARRRERRRVFILSQAAVTPRS
jgi:hypothetical protein